MTNTLLVNKNHKVKESYYKKGLDNAGDNLTQFNIEGTKINIISQYPKYLIILLLRSYDSSLYATPCMEATSNTTI